MEYSVKEVEEEIHPDEDGNYYYENEEGETVQARLPTIDEIEEEEDDDGEHVYAPSAPIDDSEL